MLKLPDTNINFIIGVHRNSKSGIISGATVALHLLAYELAKRGYNVFIFTEPDYPHENIHAINSKIINSEGFVETYEWEGFSYNYANTVSIYPNITWGNPFGTKYVVRWILYHTEKEIEETWGADDVWFKYNDFETFEKKEFFPLTVIDYKTNLFVNDNKEKSGFCHIIHKNTPPNGHDIFDFIGSTNITDWKELGFEYLKNRLNEFEYMLTYDQNTFYSVAAILCGCKVIILNPQNKAYEFSNNANSDSNLLTPLEFRLKYPIFMVGVAYGWNDIQWANKTIDLARSHIESLREIDMKTIDDFGNYWEKEVKK